MTLMKSNTTRRSQPMIRSRLRSPTSKSMTTVLCPRNASPAAKAAAVAVLAAPPLADVIITTFAKIPRSSGFRPIRSSAVRRDRFPAREDRSATLITNNQASNRGDGQPIIDERDLHRGSPLLGRQLLADEIAPGDADQLGLEPRAEDSRILVAARDRKSV